MSYIVASATEPDIKFETYDDACGWAQSMRNLGVDVAIVTSNDPWKYWSVWESGINRPYVVSARSADEALVVARGITGDYNLDTVQCH
nr:MAG TPA: hypothetical protein [Caudoviricetes sp.]